MLATPRAPRSRLRYTARPEVPRDVVNIRGSGESAVDESALTGESLPVEKSFSSEVYAGTLNQFVAIEIEVLVVERMDELVHHRRLGHRHPGMRQW